MLKLNLRKEVFIANLPATGIHMCPLKNNNYENLHCAQKAKPTY